NLKVLSKSGDNIIVPSNYSFDTLKSSIKRYLDNFNKNRSTQKNNLNLTSKKENKLGVTNILDEANELMQNINSNEYKSNKNDTNDNNEFEINKQDRKSVV